MASNRPLAIGLLSFLVLLHRVAFSSFDLIIPYLYIKLLQFFCVFVYVDDLIIIGNGPAAIQSSKKHLSSCFYIKDLGHLKYFLGIEIAYNSKKICLCLRKYALDILSHVGLFGVKSVDFPIEQHHSLERPFLILFRFLLSSHWASHLALYYSTEFGIFRSYLGSICAQTSPGLLGCCQSCSSLSQGLSWPRSSSSH